MRIVTKSSKKLLIFIFFLFTLASTQVWSQKKHKTEKPEYFLLRPETEKAYGYSHAVKIGNDIKTLWMHF